MNRREFLRTTTLGVSTGIAAPTLNSVLSTPAHAGTKVVKVGTLKLIIGMAPFLYEKVAEPDYRFDITVFDSPADVTAAVATRSVDVGMVGYPVAVLAFSNGQPITVIGASTDGGFGIVADAKSEIKSLQNLKDKRVAVQPSSTVETLFRLRQKEVGLGPSDVQLVRLMFQDMPGALQRGDVDAYVGIEPGPSISTLNGSGRIVDLPYNTPAGGLNLVLTANPDIVEKDPASVIAFLRTHRRAVEAARATPSLYVDAAIARLGVARPLAEQAMKNIYVQWQIDEKWLAQTNFYNQAMADVKQIKQLPDMKKFVNTKLIAEIAKEK
jgi:NitT/TauT family transport system substrate-binding protein